MVEVFKRLDAASGESAEFNFKDNQTLLGKFIITGTASSNIKIFEAREERGNNSIFKAFCSNWNGATVSLHLKTTHADDAFSNSAVVFSENSAMSSDIR